MNQLKNILSLFLLFLYGLSFAQSKEDLENTLLQLDKDIANKKGIITTQNGIKASIIMYEEEIKTLKSNESSVSDSYNQKKKEITTLILDNATLSESAMNAKQISQFGKYSKESAEFNTLKNLQIIHTYTALNQIQLKRELTGTKWDLGELVETFEFDMFQENKVENGKSVAVWKSDYTDRIRSIDFKSADLASINYCDADLTEEGISKTDNYYYKLTSIDEFTYELKLTMDSTEKIMIVKIMGRKVLVNYDSVYAYLYVK